MMHIPGSRHLLGIPHTAALRRKVACFNLSP
jgi:hypothetical protein